MKTLLVCGLLVVVVLSTANACTCRYKGTKFTPRHAICCAQFIMRGKVEGEERHGRGRYRHIEYDFKVKEIFKGFRILKKVVRGNHTYVSLRTPAQKSQCGILLPSQTDLVVTGYAMSNEMIIGKCSSWYKEWQNITSVLKTLIINHGSNSQKCTCLW